MSAARNAEIHAAYLSGENARKIGLRFGLTKQRVIQIAKSLGAPGRVYEPTEGDGEGWGVCKVEGCGSISRSRWGTLCNTHYFRGRRTGTTDDRERRGPSLTSHGYLARNLKGHPAASKSGGLYEHRKVFYETYGPDGHQCFWCGVSLQWGGSGRGKISVDHLNGDKTDNSPDNLKPSCNPCNSSRGLFMSWIARHKDDPILKALLS